MSKEPYLSFFPTGEVWELEGDLDPTDFFRAMKLFLGQDLVLCIEAGGIELRLFWPFVCSKELDAQILSLLQPHNATEKHRIQRNTLWPKSMQLHLALTPALLDALCEISENNAVPDYADHVVLYGNEILLVATDFTMDPFQMSRSLPESVVKEFAAITKTKYRSAVV